MIALLALLIAIQPGPGAVPAPPVHPVIVAERAFAARAQTEGLDAFRATAAHDAIMFSPGPVNAHEFLTRSRLDPPPVRTWAPARAWVSCDDTLAVTTGPWSVVGGTKVGTFTTVWQRQPDGGWRWVYDNGREIPRAIEAPDVPPVLRSACPGDETAPSSATGGGIWLQRENRMPGEWGQPIQPIPSAPPVASGRSADGSLRWEVHHRPEQGPNAYMFQVWQTTVNRDNGVPRAVGSLPPPPVGTHLVIAESHGFTSPVTTPAP